MKARVGTKKKALNFNFGMWKIYFVLDLDSFSKFSN
jgi:hypothetical protein